MVTIDWSKYPAVRITSAYPSMFDEQRFTIQQLRQAASRAEVLFRGWPFIFYGLDRPRYTYVINDGIESSVDQTGKYEQPVIEQWNLLRSGLLIHRTLMRELSYPQVNGKRIFDTMETIYHVAEAIGSLWRLYEALSVPHDEEITIEFSYEDTKGRELVVLDPRRAPLFPGRICHAASVEISRTFPLEMWRASDVGIAAEVCFEIFQQFQWEPSLRQLEDEIRPFLGKVAPQFTR